MLNYMNIMTDIAAAMNEHSQGVSLIRETPSATNIFVTATNVGTYTTWWETIKIYFFVVYLVFWVYSSYASAIAEASSDTFGIDAVARQKVQLNQLPNLFRCMQFDYWR